MRRRDRRRLRARLAEQDRLAAQRAELRSIGQLLDDAATVVDAGWVQHGWSTAGAGGSVSRACVVGAIVHAAGGPAAVRSQLVQRTLDLTWHTLYNEPHQPVRWCPAPAVRLAHVRDLTRWNDQSERTAAQVTALLAAAVRTAAAQTELLREARPATDLSACG